MTMDKHIQNFLGLYCQAEPGMHGAELNCVYDRCACNAASILSTDREPKYESNT